MIRNPSKKLGQQLDAQQIAERQRALVALLREPLILPHGRHSDTFLLIRRHSAWLQDWFNRYPGWLLRVDTRCARLQKIPPDTMDRFRGAIDHRSGQPFTRQRYALLCLALAALEHVDRQTTLGTIANRVVGAVTQDSSFEAAGLTLDLTVRTDRENLVRVMRKLVDLGVLTRMDGDEQRFISDQAQDVLYNVNRDAAAAMLVTRQGPSLVKAETLDDRLAEITREPAAETEEARLQRCRANLYRRLLEDPVMYFDELPEEERQYWTTQRSRLVSTIERATGLASELRSEGVAMVDESGAATDLRVTEEGTDGHITLLLAEFLAGRLRQEGPTAVSRAELENYLAELMPEYRSYWRKDATQPGAEVTLVGQTLRRLAGLKLISWTDNGAVPRPAIARYALDGVRMTQTNDLFNGGDKS